MNSLILPIPPGLDAGWIRNLNERTTAELQAQVAMWETAMQYADNAQQAARDRNTLKHIRWVLMERGAAADRLALAKQIEQHAQQMAESARREYDIAQAAYERAICARMQIEALAQGVEA